MTPAAIAKAIAALEQSANMSTKYCTGENLHGDYVYDEIPGAKEIKRNAASALAGLKQWAETPSELDKLRAEGWAVGCHNDYWLKGERHTFWLLTHRQGHWIKGEATTDEAAIVKCRRQADRWAEIQSAGESVGSKAGPDAAASAIALSEAGTAAPPADPPGADGYVKCATCEGSGYVDVHDGRPYHGPVTAPDALADRRTEEKVSIRGGGIIDGKFENELTRLDATASGPDALADRRASGPDAVARAQEIVRGLPVHPTTRAELGKEIVAAITQAVSEEDNAIIECIRSTTWSGSEEIVDMLKRHIVFLHARGKPDERGG